jgi:hypothetical protein
MLSNFKRISNLLRARRALMQAYEKRMTDVVPLARHSHNAGSDTNLRRRGVGTDRRIRDALNLGQCNAFSV